MIRPILEYGCVLFDNCTANLSQSIEAVQYEAARICLGATRYTPRVLLLEELGWQTLSNRRKYFKLILFFKMYNRLTPQYLHDLVPRDVAFTTGRLLRNRADLRQIRFQTQRFGDSFLPSTINSWNNLPVDARDTDSLLQFKSKLKLLYLNVDKKPSYFKHGSRFLNICHTQLRLNYSVLNAHLHHVNILPASTCACSHPSEDTKHYLLFCPKFVVQRGRPLNTVCHFGLNIFYFMIIHNIHKSVIYGRYHEKQLGRRAKPYLNPSCGEATKEQDGRNITRPGTMVIGTGYTSSKIDTTNFTGQIVGMI